MEGGGNEGLGGGGEGVKKMAKGRVEDVEDFVLGCVGVIILSSRGGEYTIIYGGVSSRCKLFSLFST